MHGVLLFHDDPIEAIPLFPILLRRYLFYTVIEARDTVYIIYHLAIVIFPPFFKELLLW